MIHFLQPTHLFPKAKVEKVCSWYYQMKAIIGEHPNTKPVGIGNSTSELNLDVLVTSTQDGGTSLEGAKPAAPSEMMMTMMMTTTMVITMMITKPWGRTYTTLIINTWYQLQGSMRM